MVLNEVPHYVILLLAASTLLAIVSGDIRSFAAWLTVGAAGLTGIALLFVEVRATRSRAVIEDALRRGLGVGVQPVRTREWRRLLLAPYPFRDRAVKRTRNLSYGRAGKFHRFDLYRARVPTPAAPVLVHWHGGGFRHGTKSREACPLLFRFARAGWVCISANYRIAPQASFPAAHIDAKRLIAWIREHADELGADPAAIFVSGSSAGAHLALLTALTPNDPRFQPGFEGADTSVTAAISLYAYYGPVADGPLPSSPSEYSRPDAPPLFLLHGTNDTYVPVEAAREAVDALASASRDTTVYAELPFAQHSFDLVRSLRFDAVVDGIDAFTAWVRAR
jgi:acetyl esterase/lipase